MIDFVLELQRRGRVSTGRGDTAVHALRGVSLGVPPRRARGGHGAVWIGQVHAAERRRRTGQPDRGGSRRGRRSEMDAKGRAALRRRRIGYVFQDFNLIPALTAAENVSLPRELDGVGLKRRAARRRTRSPRWA